LLPVRVHLTPHEFFHDQDAVRDGVEQKYLRARRNVPVAHGKIAVVIQRPPDLQQGGFVPLRGLLGEFQEPFDLLATIPCQLRTLLPLGLAR
jgi:hypothetical protein